MNRTVYSHVVVFGIDGMGNFNLRTDTPNIDRIAADGAVTYHALSMAPTISAQNWCAMLLGAAPEVHRFTNSNLGRVKNENPALPSLFARVRAAMPDATIISCSEWGAINGLIDECDRVDATTARGSAAMMEIIMEKIRLQPTLLFIQLEDPDKAGHAGEYGSDDHLAAIRLDDSYLGAVYDAYRDMGILDDTLFLVITDHGGVRNGHGGYTDGEKYVTLAAAGKHVPHGEIGDACTRDISAIVLHALGIDVPAYDEQGFSSQVPDGIFPEVSGTYKKAEIRVVDFEIRETPDLRAEDGLYAYLEEDRVRLAIFCDNSVADVTGKNAHVSHNLPKYYSEGILGSRGEFGRTGYVTFPDFKLGEGSYSVAVWAKVDRSLDEGVVIWANKNWFWRDREDLGMGLSFRANDTVFSIGTGDDQEEYMAALPADTDDDGWVHVISIVDKETMTYRLYYNFKPVFDLAIPEKYRNVGDTEMPFTVGNDGTGAFSNEKYDLIVNLDDFLLIDGVVTDEDAKRLAAYYRYPTEE